jgi:cellulose synthase operon protein C
MRRRLVVLSLCAAAPLIFAAETGKTLKDLQKRRVEIHVEAPSQASAGKAMENYRRFLELQKTDPALRAEALRRLGDLSLESGELERMENEVTRVDLGGAEAVRLYTLLLKAHPDYPRNDQVLYQLARAYETTGQADKALATLDVIVRRFPASREIGEVHFRRGELLFSAQRYHDAEAAYALVTQKIDGTFYQQGLYKQGWSLFKQSLNEESLPVFAKLLDLRLTDRNATRGYRPLDTLGRADREMIDDTLRVMSVTFSSLDGVEPLDRFVTKIGSPPYAALLYSRLGDLYVDKQRFQDGAATYRAFVARDPNNEFSPILSMQAIEAYRKGGFAQLVLDGKREYVEKYNLGTAFWARRDRANYPQIITELKTNLTDLAAFHHSSAQKTKRAEDYALAARWYRLQLQSFPEDADSATVNFRLADVLYEGGQYADAVTEYERSAYAYPVSADSAKAAYAALSAYQKQEPLVAAAEKAAWKLKSIESGVKFAQTFPAHADAAGVLTRATQDLYAARNLQRAMEVAALLLARNPPPDLAQRRIGFSVIGQSRFDLGEFQAAEVAWTQARDLAVGTDAERKILTDQLAVAVYRQAEAKRSAGDAVGAVNDFLRIAKVAPGTGIVETSQYDAAAALITLKDWPHAIEVLEGFRRDYPASKQQSDVTQKLAVAYMESGRSDSAAVEFERIANVKDQPPAVRLEALGIAAEQYEKSGNSAKTIGLLEKLVAEYPTPVAERIESRQRLAEFAAKANNVERQRYWQREIVKADGSAGGARTDRTRYLAAKASLALAAPTRDAFRNLKLMSPLKKSLAAKRVALEAALTAYKGASAYNVAEVTTQASFEMAELYRQLGADLLASERPKKLDADSLEQYALLLEEQAIPFEEQAIKLHEANAAHAHDGLYDDGVKASFAALAKLLPARYGKTEIAGSLHATPILSESALPAETGATAAAMPTVSNRVASQFSQAVQLAQSGKPADAELEFKQLLEAAPAASGAAYNLGVLLRTAGRLEEAESAFKSAATTSPRSALALTDLGLARRERGEFAAAQEAYQSALAADPNFAIAYRNLAVLQDMYLGDPVAGLGNMERYQAMTGEEKPVTSWIADLRQRAGKASGAVTPANTEAPK